MIFFFYWTALRRVLGFFSIKKGQSCVFIGKVDWKAFNIVIIMYSYVLFLQTVHYKATKRVKTNSLSLSLSQTHTHTHTIFFFKCTHTHRVNGIAWRGEVSKMIWKMWVCLMIWLCKGDCSKQTEQHKKNISDQASACAQREKKMLSIWTV